MGNAKKSNWFHVPMRSLVYLGIVLVLSVLMLMPWSYSTITEGGTSWESIMTMVVTIVANLILIIGCFRK